MKVNIGVFALAFLAVAMLTLSGCQTTGGSGTTARTVHGEKIGKSSWMCGQLGDGWLRYARMTDDVELMSIRKLDGRRHEIYRGDDVMIFAEHLLRPDMRFNQFGFVASNAQASIEDLFPAVLREARLNRLDIDPAGEEVAGPRFVWLAQTRYRHCLAFAQYGLQPDVAPAHTDGLPTFNGFAKGYVCESASQASDDSLRERAAAIVRSIRFVGSGGPALTATVPSVGRVEDGRRCETGATLASKLRERGIEIHANLRKALESYAVRNRHKALAVSPSGAFGKAVERYSAENAMDLALAYCKDHGSSCRLVLIGDRLVDAGPTN